jgi:hypothetical protein
MVRREGLRSGGRVRGGRGKKLRKAFLWQITRAGLHEYDEWIAQLAQEYPEEAWLQQIDTAPPDFEPEPWHGLYWRAWQALRFDRPYGALGGEGYIPYTVLRTWARDHDIEGEELDLFLRFMGEIDAEWLKHQASKAKD